MLQPIPAAPAESLKRCTGCQNERAVQEFYLRSAEDPHGPRRARCKTCEAKESARRYRRGLTTISELIKFGSGNPDALSEAAFAEAYTDQPLDPKLVEAYRQRQRAAEQRQARQERLSAQEVRPMRFARLGVSS